LVNKKATTLLLMVLSLALSACGGGGGDSAGSSNGGSSNGSNNNGGNSNTADTIKPAISLTGPSIVTIEEGESYFDQGATASDNVDLFLTDSIVKTGSVGNTAGTYTLTYSVQDSAGNTATITRTVIVEESQGGTDNGGNGSGSTEPSVASMIEGFGGAVFDEDTSTYTYPSGTEDWAGFANMNFDIYPMSFAEGGTITFTAAIPAGGSATSLYFRFERLPYPEVDPSFNLDPVLVAGQAEQEYTVTIPAQPSANTYSSFLMYVVDKDSPVVVKNIVVTDDPGQLESPSDGGGDNTTGGGSATVKAINSTNWFHQTRLPNGWGWFNDEQQHYTDRIENSYVSNGSLKIVAMKGNYTDQGQTKQYTSARLNSKYAFKYGRVEIRAKMPTGAGTWPAIWTLGKNITENGGYWQTQGYGTTGWPACGEIDIIEHWGNNQNYVQSAMHTPSSHGGTVNYGGQYINTASEQFHTYEMDWNSDRIIFSVNGFEHYRYAPTVKNSETWPYDAEQYLLLNIAIQDNISSSFDQSAMEIDYVRIYADGAGPSDPPIWADEFE
jgi:beta-glucanase (GH16 family)